MLEAAIKAVMYPAILFWGGLWFVLHLIPEKWIDRLDRGQKGKK